MERKDKVKMVFRTIGIITLGVLISSLAPIVYGPLAIIISPFCVAVAIIEAVDLNKMDISNYEWRKKHTPAIKTEDLESMH